jgi:hypothetical protein
MTQGPQLEDRLRVALRRPEGAGWPDEHGAFDRFLRHRARRGRALAARAGLALVVALALAAVLPRLLPRGPAGPVTPPGRSATLAVPIAVWADLEGMLDDHDAEDAEDAEGRTVPRDSTWGSEFSRRRICQDRAHGHHRGTAAPPNDSTFVVHFTRPTVDPPLSATENLVSILSGLRIEARTAMGWPSSWPSGSLRWPPAQKTVCFTQWGLERMIGELADVLDIGPFPN